MLAFPRTVNERLSMRGRGLKVNNYKMVFLLQKSNNFKFTYFQIY